MRILVTLDGSDLSETALGPAKQVADEQNAEIYLMRVADTPPKPSVTPRVRSSDALLDSGSTGRPLGYVQTPTDYEATIDDKTVTEHLEDEAEQEMLQYLKEKGIFFGDRSVMYEIAIDDDPAEMIIESAQENEIDLIVMATHDRSGLGKLLKGSVADEVLESGVAPVLLVHPTGETEMLPAGSER